MADDRTRPQEADDLVQRVQGENVTWVEIASTGGEDEAKLLAGFLEAEGIPAQIESVEFHEMPTNFGAMGDIRIYVATEDEPRALALLRERQVAYDKLDDDDDTLVTDEGPADIDENAEPEEG
jgi:organic radical activating enzyme